MTAPEDVAAPRVGALRSGADSGVMVLVISGRIDRDDVPGVCERVKALLGPGHLDRVVCDVGALVEPGIAALDALARLQLAATRLGFSFCVRGAPPRLQVLLALTGLDEVVPLRRLPFDQGRQSEDREQ